MSRYMARRAVITALGVLLAGGGVAGATEAPALAASPVAAYADPCDVVRCPIGGASGSDGPDGVRAPVNQGRGKPPSVGVAPCSLNPTSGTITRTLGSRAYRLRVPPGLTGPSVPLLLALHGAGQEGTGLNSAAATETITGFNADAAAHGYIVAYPATAAVHPTAWDATRNGPDVTFLRRVAADISAGWCVNPKRVHVAGYSSGAIMAERLACDAPDVFASVGAYAGASPVPFGGPCTPSRPIAVGIFQGLLDPLSSQVIGAANRDEWLTRNGCPTTPRTEPGVALTASTYGPCRNGVEVVWRVYLAQGHGWPTGDDNADIRNRMRALFERNPRP